MNTSEIKAVRKLLSSSKNIVIVTHWSPDGDAMGSSLGMYNYLRKKDHSVTVITPNDYPDFLRWLPGDKQVINHSEKPKAAANKIAAADIIFCLDFNSLKRINQLGDLIGAASAKKLIIDHHLQPDDFADFMLHNVSIGSTCELIHQFMKLMGDLKLLDKNIANCLYTGIMTDTGSFRYPSTSAETHRIIAELIAAGAENSDIHMRIYDDYTEGRLRLLGYCLSKKLVVLPEFHTAYFSLSETELKKFNYKKGDTEGVVNYALSMRGIRFAAFFVERDGMIKVSFRSKGAFNVNLFSRENFQGGGHANAAGGASNESLSKTIRRFEALLTVYKSQLTQKK